MKKYLSMVKLKVYRNFLVKFVQIPREENEQANCLAKAATMKHMAINNQVLSFVQHSPANDKMDIQVIPKGDDWMASIISYLKNKMFPEDNNASRKLKVRASRFILMGDILYKRGFFRPYLRCLAPIEIDYVMREVYKEVCGNHLGARSLVYNLIHVGYYWPIVQKDTQSYVKACDKCQLFSNIIRQPSEQLTPMNAPWPFAQWGLNIMSPFPMAIW